MVHRGSLQDVIDRGQFYLDRSDIDKGPKMDAILATASEMAQVGSVVRCMSWPVDETCFVLLSPSWSSQVLGLTD